LLDRHERGELGQEEAAEMLGISERTFRRWRDRLRDEGPVGLRDRRIGKPSSRKAAVEEIQRMLGLYEERYSGFTVKHFHEQLQKRRNYKLGYTVTRLSLHGAGLVRPAPKRSAHRKKRPRRPLVGMMLHQDASRFAWLPGEARQYDLVVTCPSTTPPSRWRRPRPAALSCRTAPAPPAKSSASRRSAGVGNDNTVKWRGLILQIPPSPLRPHFVRATVRLHEYPDRRLAVFHGPHRLADYDAAGNLLDAAKLAA
jgi:transposase